MNAYRLVLEGPSLHEEVTFDAPTILDAACVAEEYRELVQDLTADTEPATNTGARLRLQLEPAR